MSETNGKFPTWVWIYGILVMVIAPIALGLMFLLNPEGIPGNEGGAAAVAPYAIRNITAGLATIFALYYRSRSMMLVMFVMRLLTDIGDYVGALIGMGFSFPFLLIMIVVFWTGAVFGIRAFWPAKDIDYAT